MFSRLGPRPVFAAGHKLVNVVCLRSEGHDVQESLLWGGGAAALVPVPTETQMLEPRSAVSQFVKVVARVELARGGGAKEHDVAQRLTKRLNAALVKLVGPGGFDVLLARALVLARRTHPLLKGITSTSGGALSGLDEPTRDAAELREASLAIVAYFIELLAQLVGEDLAMRLVRDVWPGEAEESEEKP